MRTIPLQPAHADTSARTRAALSAVCVAMIAAGAMILLLGERSGSALKDAVGAASAWTVVGGSAAFALSLWLREGWRHAQLVGAALCYTIATCLLLAVAEAHSHMTPVAVLTVSWGCLLILVVPPLVRASPIATALAGGVAAGMIPLGHVIGGLLDPPHHSMGVTAGIIAPAVAVLLSWAIVRTTVATTRRHGVEAIAGSYALIERLGAGGMAEVWRAVHVTTRRAAAVKLIRPEQTDPERQYALLAREATAMAALHSPHTLQILDFGVADGRGFYLATELLEGADLEAMVQRFGPLAPRRVIHLLVQACDALAEAHDANLVHRDIKPSNLFVSHARDTYDLLKVLDFGLVRAIGCDKDAAPFTPSTLPGTPAYIAPEVVLAECHGECFIDGRADLYALGCVAFWALTGRLVFEATTAPEMVVAHASERPVAPSTVTEAPIPPALDTLVLACLEKDPAARPASAQVLRGRLVAVSDRTWSQEDAASWWNKHLPGPLAQSHFGARELHQASRSAAEGRDDGV